MIPNTFTQRGIPLVDPGSGSAMCTCPLSVPAGASNLYEDDSLYENSVSMSNQYVAVPP